MSHIIGPGNRGVVGQQAAAQRAAQVARQSAHIAQQNMLRQQMMNRQLIQQLVPQIVEAAPTREDVQRAAEILQEAEQQGLEPQQVEARVQETTRLGWLVPLLPQNRGERIAYLQILVDLIGAILTAIALVVGPPQPTPQPPPPPTITPEQAEEIIDQLQRMADQMEQQQTNPPPEALPPIPPQQVP